MKPESRKIELKQDLWARALWQLLANYKNIEEARHNEQNYLKYLSSLCRTLDADLGFIIPIEKNGMRKNVDVHIEENLLYVNRMTYNSNLVNALRQNDWNIYADMDIFSFDDESCRVFEIEEMRERFPQLIREHAFVILRGRILLEDIYYFWVFGWSNRPDNFAFLFQSGKYLIKLFLDMLSFRKDELFTAINKWADSHKKPDDSLLVIGHRSYSARQIAKEVHNRTGIGAEIRKSILADSANKILKRGK